jgi:23S rRNA pseudouridine2605 synthase
MMTQAERGQPRTGRGPKRTRPAKAAITSTAEGERIAKVLARAGLCSRRGAEKLIAEGRVTVNGRKLASPAVNVTASDRIEIDGKALPEAEPARLWRYHKAKGLVTTHRDPEGRPTVFQRLPQGLPRVISVGRLDINTEGLLLLTNDGALARLLELPSTGWLRRYRVRAHGTLTQADLDKLKNGVTVEGVHYGPIEAQIDRQQGGNVWMTIGLREGKNREIKRILEFLNVTVNRLIRISFGPFMLGDLATGSAEEVKTRVLRDQLGEKAIAEAGITLPRPAREATAKGGTANVKRPQVRKMGGR